MLIVRKSVTFVDSSFDAEPTPVTTENVDFLLFPVAASFPRNVILIPVSALVVVIVNLTNALIRYKSCLCLGTGINQNNFLKKKYNVLNEKLLTKSETIFSKILLQLKTLIPDIFEKRLTRGEGNLMGVVFNFLKTKITSPLFLKNKL